MPKLIRFLQLTATLFIISCGSNEPKDTQKEIIREKETVIVPAPTPPVVIRDSVEKPTSVTLDKNGVKVQSKKVDIKVEPGN